MLSLTLIERWANDKNAAQFTDALVSVAVQENWPCFLRGEMISWERWAEMVKQADPTVPARAVLEVALACREGTLQGDIINNLDLEACWAFTGRHGAFWQRWGQMLIKYGACPVDSLEAWMAQRETLPITQFTL